MIETNDDDLTTSKIYRYKCIRCNIIFSEIDLLKDHYFDKHINTSGLTTTNDNNKLIIKKLRSNNKRKKSNLSISLPNNIAADDDDDEYNEVEHSINNNKTATTSFRTNSEITIKRPKLEKLTKDKEEATPFDNNNNNNKGLSELNEEEMKKFNLENIDETELLKEIGDGVYNKKRELLAGKIAWVQWRTIMWPALIVKVTSRSTTSSSTSSLKIHIRFYEMNQKLGSVFKMDPSKVELFYKCKEHENYKLLGALNPGQRKEFYTSYTNALKDYIELAKDTPAVTQAKTEESTISVKQEEIEGNNNNNKKYTIEGKKYTIEEIKELASKSYSNEQIEENKNREENSKNLVDLVLSEECNNYLISIMSDTNPTKCSRRDEYLSSDSRTRRTRLKFNNIGPLTQEDSVKIGQHLLKLSKEHFINKPLHLINYEYDVLYPEAIIWGLKNLYKITYKKAELRWKQGFRSTKEELIKLKCNELINKNPSIFSTTNSIVNGEGDSSFVGESYQESEFNEVDTSFFTYCNNDNIDKKFNDKLSELNEDNEEPYQQQKNGEEIQI